MWMFILSLIIPFLIFGPFIPDLIVSLSAMVFLVYVFKKKKFYYFNNKPLIIFFIFCIYCVLVSIFFAKDVLVSFESSLFYFRIGVFACLIWYLIDKNKKILDLFFYILIGSFSVLVVDGYVQFFTGLNIIGIPKQGARLSSFFNDELILGSYLSRLFPFIFALFFYKQRKKIEFYYFGIFLILLGGLIYLTGERAAFFLFNLSLLFIIIFTKEYKKFKIFLLAGYLICIFLNIFFFKENKNRMFVSLFQSLDRNIVSVEHDSHFKTAFKMFLDKPIFGHGPKMFRILCKDDKYSTGSTPCSTHPHNFYLQLLAETGIIGCSFLLSAFLYVLYCTYRQFKSIVLKHRRYLTNYQVCLVSGILITVWPLVTNGNFFNNWLAIVYSLPVGFYLNSIYSKKRENIFKK
jgi:O-antigen ligase